MGPDEGDGGVETIDASRGLADLGLDSLMAVEFVNELSVLVGEELLRSCLITRCQFHCRSPYGRVDWRCSGRGA